jgi:hypothetical protein
MIQTYNEFIAVFENGKAVKKVATERKTVRISAHTAKVNNNHGQVKGLYYELAKVQPDDKKVNKPNFNK